MRAVLALWRKAYQIELVRASLILLLLLNVCFSPCIWGHRTLLESAQDVPSVLPNGGWNVKNKPRPRYFKVLDPGAPGWYSEPLLALIHHQLAFERTTPLWNPYEAFGAPLLASMQAQPCFPLVLPLILFLTPKTYSLYVLLRLFLAGLGAFAFFRLFVSFSAAICGSLATMFAGYFVLYITMPHLSVEMWIPAALFAVEYLLRRPGYTTFLGMLAVVLLSILGGMPESTALLLTFSYVYAVFRIATEAGFRLAWRTHAARLASVAICGIALSAFFLLPALEFMNNSFNAHESRHTGAITGIQHDTFDAGAFTYLFPYLFGPPFAHVFPAGFTGLRNFIGVIPLFLVVVTLTQVCKWRKQDRTLNCLSIFFLATALLALSKRFGVPFVNAIGYLPIYRLIYFAKYEEPYFSIGVAALCSLGVEYILRRRLSRVSLAVSLSLAFSSMPLAVLMQGRALQSALSSQQTNLRFLVIALGLPGLLLFATAVVFLACQAGSRAVEKIAGALVVLLTIELCGNFTVPAYRSLAGMAYAEVNPYAGAPFIDFLRRRTTQYERVFGREHILQPLWASAFQLFDIRNLDALYYQKYFPFIRNFLGKPAGMNDVELGDRFSGDGPYNSFETPKQRRILQLSSVRYIASTRPFQPSNELVAEILAQNQGKIKSGKERFVSQAEITVNGITKPSLFEHPPYDRLPLELVIPKRKPEILAFSYTLNPASWTAPGDGVTFRIEVRDAKGTIRKVFENYIDPKHNAADRRWADASVDLTPFAGEQVTLLLTTDPGPKGDANSDWANWAGFHFLGSNSGNVQDIFKQVYGAEISIFQYDDILPRAALYSRAELVSGQANALAKLADPKLDIFERAVLDSSSLTAQERAAVSQINSAGPPRRVRAATIRKYLSRYVEIEATTDTPALLVLNDSDYPGWTAEVDGRKTEILSANYLFRGITLQPGRHVVRFLYKPTSFRVGLAISAFTAIALFVGFFFARRRVPTARLVRVESETVS